MTMELKQLCIHLYTSSNMASAAGEQLEVFYEAHRRSLLHLFT
jgi:hypothetical protein